MFIPSLSHFQSYQGVFTFPAPYSLSWKHGTYTTNLYIVEIIEKLNEVSIEKRSCNIGKLLGLVLWSEKGNLIFWATLFHTVVIRLVYRQEKGRGEDCGGKIRLNKAFSMVCVNNSEYHQIRIPHVIYWPSLRMSYFEALIPNVSFVDHRDQLIPNSNIYFNSDAFSTSTNATYSYTLH